MPDATVPATVVAAVAAVPVHVIPNADVAPAVVVAVSAVPAHAVPNNTVTAAVVTGVSSVPYATIGLYAPTVATFAAIPAPAMSISSDVAAAVVSASAAVLAATINVMPTTVVAVGAVPSATATASANVAAATVATVAAVPSSQFVTFVFPAIVTAQAAVPTADVPTVVTATVVTATSTVPAPGIPTIVTPLTVAATARVPDGYGHAVLITADDAHFSAGPADVVTAQVGVPVSEHPIGPPTIAAVAAVPYADNGAPPGPVTGLAVTATDQYSITLEWMNPTDGDYDHVIIMRSDGLPYAEVGDELIDTDIVKIETTGILSGAGTLLDPVVVTSGAFTNVQNTTGRPISSPNWDSYPGSPGTWYSYTPATSGTLVLTAEGSVINDTLIHLVADDQTTVLIYNDDDPDWVAHGLASGSRSYIEWSVAANTTYYISVASYSPTEFGVLQLTLTGPAPVAPPPPGDPTYTDTGLVSGRTYFYAFYTTDINDHVNLDAVTISGTTTALPAGAPMPVTVTMLAGTVSVLAGTPVPAPVGDISYYGFPLNAAVTMPAGVVWVNNMINPPPPRPGSEVGIISGLYPPGTTRTDTDIWVEVWDHINTTKLGDLDYSAARQFLDEYNGVGSGTLQVPAVHESAALLKRDRVLRFHYKDIADPVFASIIEGRNTAVIADPGSNWASVSGRGTLAWLEDAVVLPYVDLNGAALPMSGIQVNADGSSTAIQSNLSNTAADVRAFNFGSRDIANGLHTLFHDTGPGSSGSNQELLAPWSNLTGGDGVVWAARSDMVRGYPMQWPDPLAKWIWQTNPQADVQDGLRVSFRSFFTLGAATTVDIYGCADDFGDFFIDGEYLFSTTSWKAHNHVRRTLAAGEHELQIIGRNVYAPAIRVNPASVIATIINLSNVVVFRTDTTGWQYTRYINTFSTTEANHGPGWHLPLGVKQSAVLPLNNKQFFPSDWPDPNAQWIWGSDPTMTSDVEQICYFRNVAWIGASGTYRWFVTADDGYVCWVDGIEVLSMDYQGSAENGWKRYDTIDLDLEQGYHVFSIRGRNQTNAAQYTVRGNPAAVLATLMTLDANLKPDNPVPGTATSSVPGTSNTGWYSNWYAPAWNAGDVLYTLFDEARARGVTRLQNVTLDFDRTTDSMGQPWTTRVSRTWDVGTPLLQVAFELCELGVDIWMTAENVLRCAERRGEDIPEFSIQYGKNISGYDVDETFSGSSVAYTRTRSGWYTLTNDTSQLILGGKRESAISLANTDSEDILLGVSRRAIGSVVMANMVATAQEIIPIVGSVPYTDVNISDIINVLSPDGSSRMGRLLSISVSENAAGSTTWVPEIEIWNSPFGDGVDPSRPHDPVDPNSPYDPSTWVPAAEDWTRFIPEGAGSDYPRWVTKTQADTIVDGGTAATRVAAVTAPPGNGSGGGGSMAPLAVPSPSPAGATPVPLNSAQNQRPAANAQNIAASPDGERVAVSPTAPKITAGYHLWVDTSGIV